MKLTVQLTHTAQRPILTSFFPLNNIKLQGTSRAGTTRVAVQTLLPALSCVSVPPRPCPPGATARGPRPHGLRAHPLPSRGAADPIFLLSSPLLWSLVLCSEPMCSWGSVRGPLFSLHTWCPSDLCQASALGWATIHQAPAHLHAAVLRVFLISLLAPRSNHMVPALPPSGPAAGTAEAADQTSTRSSQTTCCRLLSLGHCALPPKKPWPIRSHCLSPLPSSLRQPLLCFLSPGPACSGHLTQTNVYVCPWGSGFLPSV